MATAGGANTPMSYAKESVYGVAETGVSYLYLAQKDDKLTPGLEYARSELLTTSAFPKNQILVDANGQGGFDSELLYAAHDDFLLGAIRASAFSSTATAVSGTGITAAAADNSFSDSGNGFTTANGFAVGKWVRAKGFSSAANNGLFRVVTRTDAKITVVGGTLVNATGLSGHNIKPGKYAVDGSTITSVTFERQYKDKTNLFVYSPGHIVEAFNIGLSPKGIIQVGVTTRGKPEVSASSARGSGFTAVSTNPSMNTVTDVSAFLFNYSALTKVADIGINIANELEPIPVIGLLGPSEIAAHDATISGNFRVILPDDHTLADKALTNDVGAFAVTMKDTSGHYMVFDIPQVKFTSLDRSNKGRKSTIYLEMQYEAIIHPTEGIAIQVAKWDD